MIDPILQKRIKLFSFFTMQDMLLKVRSIDSAIFSIPLPDLAERVVPVLEDALSNRDILPNTDFYIWAAQLAEQAGITSEDPDGISTYAKLSETQTPQKELLSKYTWDSAKYLTKLNSLVTSVVLPEADNLASCIIRKVTETSAILMSGGEINRFDWGLLSDPMFVHAVMTFGMENLNIFKPQEQTIMYYYTAALAYATRTCESVVSFAPDRLERLEPTLVSLVPDEDDRRLLTEYGLTSGKLYGLLTYFDESRRDPKDLVDKVLLFSRLATIVHSTQNAILTSDATYPQDLKDRLDVLSKITLSFFAGIEVLRTLYYTDTLILWTGKRSDGAFEVIINGDVIPALESAGASIGELGSIGRYLNRSDDSYNPERGYSLTWFFNNKDAILERAKENEAKVLTEVQIACKQQSYAIARQEITSVVKSYLDQTGRDDASGVFQAKIEKIVTTFGDNPGILSTALPILIAEATGSADLTQVMQTTADMMKVNDPYPADMGLLVVFIRNMMSDFTFVSDEH